MGEAAGYERNSATGGEVVRSLLVFGVVTALAVQLWLIFVQEFNWDEFYFLGLVHEYLRGDLDKALQTLHVHLFAPLAALPGNEIEQLIAGRVVMLILQALTLVALYRLARTWAGTAASLLAVFAFASMPMTLQHGASFRADPLALALSMSALALLAHAQLRAPIAAAAGFLVAVASLVTIKVVFFAPAFAGVAAWRIASNSDRRRELSAIAAIAAAAVAAFAALYALHQALLPAAGLGKSGELVASAGSTTILDAGLLPRRLEILQAMIGAPVQVVLVLTAAAALVIDMSRSAKGGRWRYVALLGCIAPLASLSFYRNAFPYFFPFITAPAFVAVAWFVGRRGWSSAMLVGLAGAMGVSALLSLPRIANRDQSAQREVLAAVHQIFPRPVPYIDRSSMVASFPKRGFFMSTWGMLNYRQGPPIFAALLEREAIPLLILNSPALKHALGAADTPDSMPLHREDRRTLHGNYIQHWGPIWVAGKRIRLGTGPARVTILVPGIYTLEGAGATLDGRRLQPGQTVLLTRGIHELSGSAGSEIVLRWGERLPRPTRPPPAAPLFRGF